MKVSIITVTYNSRQTVEDTLVSVADQTYPFIEHIIIDGASTDGTQKVIERNRSKVSHYISEPDNGIYNAMNKGLRLASGEIVGILNGDDVFFDKKCVSAIVEKFEQSQVDAVYGDLVYVARDNPIKTVRYYNCSKFSPKLFAYGHMPAHPAFFVKNDCYYKYGYFKEDYTIASDFELLLRFLGTHAISSIYLAKTLVKMRTGGISTRNLRSNWILNKEVLRACRENKVKTNMLKILSKYFFKVLQLIKRPPKK